MELNIDLDVTYSRQIPAQGIATQPTANMRLESGNLLPRASPQGRRDVGKGSVERLVNKHSAMAPNTRRNIS
jgi:hypothetical protein